MKRAIKFLCLVLIAGLVISPACVALPAAADAETSKLVIYNWEDYIGPDVVDGFKAYYKTKTGRDIDVTYSTFDTNETMMTTINQDANSQIDLICPSEYAIQRLQLAGKLMSLTDAQQQSGYTLQNKGNINPVIYEKVAEAGIEIADYFVPYMWGTLGIMYNSDVVTEADLANGYGLLWNKAGNKELDGKIYMKDSIRDSYVAAVMYLKEEGRLEGTEYADYTVAQLINCTDDLMLELAEEVLVEQRDVLKGYGVDNDKDDMQTGKAYVDLAWSGDAVYSIEVAEEEGINLAYFVPESGGNLWFDGWAIPSANVRNIEAALMFMDYINDPVVAVENMMEIGYTSAVKADVVKASPEALQILADNEYDAEEFFADPVRYPDTSESAKLGVMKDFGSRNEAANAMWERVKSQGFPITLVVIIVVIAVIVIGVVVFFIIKNKKGSMRQKV